MMGMSSTEITTTCASISTVLWGRSHGWAGLNLTEVLGVNIAN